MSDNESEIPDQIVFQSKLFTSVDGIYFFKDDINGEALMSMPLGNKKANITLSTLKGELQLSDDAPDVKMLCLVQDALEYVQSLKVGDEFPSEMKTGTASWEVSEKHLAVAKARLSLQLVSWMSGDEEVVHDATQLQMISNDPSMKEKINAAFGEAAEKLGIDRENREEVVSLLDGIGTELSYVEALREKFEYISVVEARIADLREIYRSDQAMTETITQVQKLCSIPMTQFRNQFDEIDAQTGEIIAVLKNMASQVKYIRNVRNELFRRIWAWNDIAESWTRTPAKRSRQCEILLQETYRFLAQRFLPQKEWELFSKSQENTRKNAAENVWA
tara:strand:- start:1651 stop:2649 length:999 start_codon:yes stop_codon:yes gene_type:complete